MSTQQQDQTADTQTLNMSNFVKLDGMPSMDDLLGGKGKECGFNERKIVSGRIVEKKDNGVLVDIGCKSEGFIPKEEFPFWDDVEAGKSVDVYIVELENERSEPVLSVQKAIFEKAWSNVVSKYGEGSVAKGVVRSRVKGGLILDIEGIPAFLPGSQIDITPVRHMDDLVNKELECRVVKINPDRNNIVVSRRELLEANRADRRAALLREMQKGQVRKGHVKNITDFGAFIDLGGMDGLLHITDMSWGRVSHPSELVQIGQEIEVVVLDIDYERERVSLGYKQRLPNPWDTVPDRYPVGARIKGKVVNIMPYGAFIEIEDGVEGLIHVSEMSWTKRVSKASDIMKVGDIVEAVVLDVQRDNKKISLGLRQTTPNPWEALAKKYPQGSRIKGKVRNMTSYGAFVEIEDDIDGMIHVSDMSWTRKINNPAEILKVGQDVEAVILDINAEQQRISLGMKQLEEDPWSRIELLYKIGDVVTGKVTKITAFGAFIELSHKIDGLIHISQISDERVEKVKDVLNIGQEVEARVIKIDKEDRRIGLSRKAVRSDYAAEEQARTSERGGDQPRERRSADRGEPADSGEHFSGRDMTSFGAAFESATQQKQN